MYTDRTCGKFHYKGVDDVVSLMNRYDYLGVVDIMNAYRVVSIATEDRSKQGLKWKFSGEEEFTYFEDNRLCMGLSSSPYVFTKISEFIVRCARREDDCRIVNYLDDFCVIGGNLEQAVQHQLLFIKILRHLGFFISFKKLVCPATKIFGYIGG